MEESTRTPIASAIPPSDMMFEVMCRKYMGMKEAITAMGSAKMGTRAERKWRRKMTMMTLTTMISSMRVFWRLLIESWISSDRS